MKTITKVFAKSMDLQLVEVKNLKLADWDDQPPTVWTTYEIQKNGEMIAGGNLQSLTEEYNRQCKFAQERALKK